MIIKRLAVGIKNQDWFVVTVEIMIVVIGIFIGLQVDDWNQSRKENVQSELFLKQLNMDIESELLSIKGAIGVHEAHITNGKLAVRFLEGEDIFNEYQVKIESALELIHHIPKPQFMHGNMNSLMLGEGWVAIKDQAIIVKLKSLMGRLGNAIGIYNNIEDKIDEITTQNRYLIGFSIAKDNVIKLSYDVDKLQKSANFKIALHNTVVLHWYAMRQLNRMVSILEEYKTEQLSKPHN